MPQHPTCSRAIDFCFTVLVQRLNLTFVRLKYLKNDISCLNLEQHNILHFITTRLMDVEC